MTHQDRLAEAAGELRDRCKALSFAPPVTFVYNPLVYAWGPHQDYLRRYGGGPKRVIFLGMNPGPWGMAQVGVPFGEIGLVRDWLQISADVEKPEPEHPKRPVDGFGCRRSEVSGRRLWGFFADCFGPPQAFFAEHFVANYCPLLFLEESGRNRTPDKLPSPEKDALFSLCDEHLRHVVRILRPEWVVGVGRFAAGRAASALADQPVRTATVLHPSPASPLANRGWADLARQALQDAGVWQPKGTPS